MKKLLIILMLALSLNGCALFGTVKDATISEKVVKLDPSALELCAPLIPLLDPNNLLENSIENMAIYANCANKQSTSVKLLKQFSNYKEPK